MADGSALGLTPQVAVEDLSVRFPAGRAGFWGGQRLEVHAVDRVSFSIAPGRTLGLVGESGSGKTTIGRAILRRAPIAAGRVRFAGQDITGVSGEALRRLRRHMQPIFQDPYASLNPRMTVLELVAEPLVVHGEAASAAAAADEVAALLARVGLERDTLARYPHAFSGGQRQRIVIARALALRPDFIVADEPVSALDVSVRAQVVNLLQDLQRELGLTYLFIAHDLSVVQRISDEIAILYGGKLVEIGPAATIYADPQHPYTLSLISAIPIPDPKLERKRRRIVLTGDPPNPVSPPPGCRFQGRCPEVIERCRREAPPLEEKRPGHFAACWRRP
ncbi:MAG: ABC transporter ATP-binding protein [Rhodobacteraceae bacterium]|nr:ABC transporter ATP-binding protein [Paracoccaceae bacterium]